MRSESLERHLESRLRRIAHVALDMDGTLYRGNSLFPWTPGFLAQLQELRIEYTFLTNNPSKSAADYLNHLKQLGVSATPDQLYTSAQATVDHLHTHRPDVQRVFVLGTPSMVSEFTGAGYRITEDDPADEPDAVIVGFDTTLTYARLCRAAWWIQQGKFFVATNPDRVCPTDQPTILVDCGSFCAALEKATGRTPDVVLGKPDPQMLQGILQRHGLQAEQVAMVGDRVYTDIAMAHRAGALGVLVLSGEATREDAASSPEPPDLIVETARSFSELLLAARRAQTA